MLKLKSENIDYQNQIKEIIHNNKKTEKWNENMSGVNEKQYEKIQKLKGDVLRYKEAKDQLQSQVNKMTKDKQLFKDRINDLKEEKKKNEEIIENFKAIQEQIINQNKPPEERIEITTDVLIEALQKSKKDLERIKWKQELKGSKKDEKESVNKYLQSKLDDINFKQKVMEETLKNVKIVVEPRAPENQAVIYYHDISSNVAKLMLRQIPVVKVGQHDEYGDSISDMEQWPDKIESPVFENYRIETNP